MLNFKEKQKIFISILEQNEFSYADGYNAFISISAENHQYIFLKQLSSEKDIEYWIVKLKSRIVLKEDLAPIDDIIDDYISCG